MMKREARRTKYFDDRHVGFHPTHRPQSRSLDSNTRRTAKCQVGCVVFNSQEMDIQFFSGLDPSHVDLLRIAFDSGWLQQASQGLWGHKLSRFIRIYLACACRSSPGP